jgi:hypothetical protein
VIEPQNLEPIALLAREHEHSAAFRVEHARAGVPERIGVIVQPRRRGLDVQRAGDHLNAVAAWVQAKHARREGHRRLCRLPGPMTLRTHRSQIV